jgi:hypothetical protein
MFLRTSSNSTPSMITCGIFYGIAPQFTAPLHPIQACSRRKPGYRHLFVKPGVAGSTEMQEEDRKAFPNKLDLTLSPCCP